MDPNAPRVHPQQALAVYIEPLAVGRRVAVLGDASLGLGTRIAELGARFVCVWDPDAERARREAKVAPPGVVVQAMPQDGTFRFDRPRAGAADASSDLPQHDPHLDDPGPRNGAFDLAVVADLELFEDAEGLLAGVRRMVGSEGVALVAAPNRDGTGSTTAFDYYELFDLVAREFDDVTMIAQLPFFGVALAELGGQEDESPAVSVDTQLAGVDRTPEAFVALASQHGVRLDPYAIIELTPRAAPQEAREAENNRAALVQAGLRAEALEAQIEELRARLADAERVAREARELEDALRDGSARVRELESSLVGRTRQLAELSEEMDRARATSESELARIAEGHGAEIGRYEEALCDRAHATHLLEAELVRRERIVHELVDVLDENAQADAAGSTVFDDAAAGAADVPSPIDHAPAGRQEHEGSPEDLLVEENAQLRHKLDALALDLARREGEGQATAWAVAELERRLAMVTEAPSRETRAVEPDLDTQVVESGPNAAVERQLAAALDEIDVLRRALSQEHEARVRAESGDKLVASRAAPQRQD